MLELTILCCLFVCMVVVVAGSFALHPCLGAIALLILAILGLIIVQH